MGEPRLALLGVDIGTTHCKAGLLVEGGGGFRLAKTASRPMHAVRAPSGHFSYAEEEAWRALVEVIEEVAGVEPARLAAVGVASMAETGLLVDRASGKGLTGLIPWFDKSSTPWAEALQRALAGEEAIERFRRAGIRPSFKCSLAKLLWLREALGAIPAGAAWLSAADWAVYRLAWVMRTDPSLAGRTYAFRIDRGEWDEGWLEAWGLSPGLFPTVAASGEPVGKIPAGGVAGLPPGTPVSIAGHDHVSAAFAAGALAPGRVFDSMGTAEALLGALDGQALGPQEFASGLMYGCHTARGRLYWMGGLSASGGSVEWLRGILGDPPLSYAAMQELLERDRPEAAPTGILYFPYLNGSGSPHSDLRVRGAFLGLDATHGRADLVQAVLEGAAYELEFIRRTAEATGGRPIETIVAAGGGTRNRRWMQIKADVSGCRIEVFPTPEASLVGAALLAGAGCGVFSSQAQAAGAFAGGEVDVYTPDPARRHRYLELYEQGYVQFQEPLRRAAWRGRMDG